MWLATTGLPVQLTPHVGRAGPFAHRREGADGKERPRWEDCDRGLRAAAERRVRERALSGAEAGVRDGWNGGRRWSRAAGRPAAARARRARAAWLHRQRLNLRVSGRCASSDTIALSRTR